MLRGIVFALAVLSGIAGAQAQDNYPSRSVRIIDAYSPGGSSDLAMRLLIDAFSRELRQTAFIEAKPGAGGLVGASTFLNSPPDGYTLLIATNALLVVIPAAKDVPYDPDKDFIPLGQIWHTPQVFAVKPELKVKSLSEFVALAKASPSGVTLGSAGIGTVTHMSIELLKRETNIAVTHVPFRGSGNSLTAVIGNQIDGLFADVTMLAPHVESNAVHGLAVTGGERSPLLPAMATTIESGLPGLATTTWFGLVAPAKTPPDVVNKLRQALARALNDADYRKSVAAKGLTIGNWDAASFEQLIRTERGKWTPIIRQAGIKID